MGVLNWFKKHKDRPVLKIEPTALDRIIDAISLVFLLLLLVMVFQNYPHLPERIPIHFGKGGQADDFGSKSGIFLLPAIGLILFAVLSIATRFPHQFNYLVKITPRNAESQYRLGTRIMRFANLFVMMVFFYTDYKVINASINKETPMLDKWFVPMVLIVSILGTIIILIISLLKNRLSK